MAASWKIRFKQDFNPSGLSRYVWTIAPKSEMRLNNHFIIITNYLTSKINSMILFFNLQQMFIYLELLKMVSVYYIWLGTNYIPWLFLQSLCTALCKWTGWSRLCTTSVASFHLGQTKYLACGPITWYRLGCKWHREKVTASSQGMSPLCVTVTTPIW